MLAFLLAVVLSAHTLPARAETAVRFPVRATDGIAAWNEKVKFGIRIRERAYPATGYRECAEVAELPGAYLCANRNRAEMAAGLARASAYIEGMGKELSGGDVIPKGQILSLRDPALASYSAGVMGYDLKGPDLVSFWAALEKACAVSNQSPDVCASAAEKEIFKGLILPRVNKAPGFVVITYALDGGFATYRMVVSHEILHAQYFLRPAYERTVNEFWDAIPTEEKEAIRLGLSDYYDQSDDFLMKNEFQAFVLMKGAEQSLLAMYLVNYRDRLNAALRAGGEFPIQVR